MNVVHFSTTDYGGAYRAAERINACIRKTGINSVLVVRSKTKQNSDCIEYFAGPAGRFVSKAGNLLNLLLSSGALVTDLFGTDVSGSRFVREADVVVLHWVNSFISYRVVKKLVKTGKKIIWVMHDEWVYTEGYHYTCERVMDPGLFTRYIGAFNLRSKKRSFSGKGIVFVAVSNWIKDQALNSYILNGEEVVTVHNPLDMSVFRPIKDISVPYNTGNKKVILFGADKAISNKTKGFDHLLEVLKVLDGNKYCAICFGNAPEGSRVSPGNIDIIYTGAINNDEELVKLYNHADVMVTPSIQEAFGYTCLEALACGTPVAGFDTSGLRDQIIHKENGYLARLCDPVDLKEGIEYCIENHDKLSARARETALALSSFDVIGARYDKLLKK